MVQNIIHCYILLSSSLVRLQVPTQTSNFVLFAVKKKSAPKPKQTSSYFETQSIGNTDDFFPCVALLEAAKKSPRERKERKREISKCTFTTGMLGTQRQKKGLCGDREELFRYANNQQFPIRMTEKAREVAETQPRLLSLSNEEVKMAYLRFTVLQLCRDLIDPVISFVVK